MIITYHNYKGGTNNLVVIHEKIGKYGTQEGVSGSSAIDDEHAIKNFKRNYQKRYGKKYEE